MTKVILTTRSRYSRELSTKPDQVRTRLLCSIMVIMVRGNGRIVKDTIIPVKLAYV